MNLSTVKNAVTSKVARQILVSQKHSPKVLFAVGIVGVVVTVVLASRATLNLDATLEETQDNLEKAEKFHERGVASYSDKDYMQDKVTIYSQGLFAIVKLYGPAVVVGIVSIGALGGSHVILTRRNVGLTAAYAAVDRAFSEYRERVLGEVGPDRERELRYGSETITEKKIDSKGKTKDVEIKRVGPNGESMYARFFDNRSKSWSQQPEYNMLFLRAQQNYANDRLTAKGHVLLNDVYDMLGLERTTPGCVVGWVKDNGDSYIDFGIFDGQHVDRFYDFVTGNDGAILLDFNVDGTVYDLI